MWDKILEIIGGILGFLFLGFVIIHWVQDFIENPAPVLIFSAIVCAFIIGRKYERTK